MPMPKQGTIVVDLKQVPSLLFAMRQELAKLLRTEAGAEANPVFAKKLRALAVEFEAGATSATDRPWRRTHGGA